MIDHEVVNNCAVDKYRSTPAKRGSTLHACNITPVICLDGGQADLLDVVTKYGYFEVRNM